MDNEHLPSLHFHYEKMVDFSLRMDSNIIYNGVGELISHFILTKMLAFCFISMMLLQCLCT